MQGTSVRYWALGGAVSLLLGCSSGATSHGGDGAFAGQGGTGGAPGEPGEAGAGEAGAGGGAGAASGGAGAAGGGAGAAGGPGHVPTSGPIDCRRDGDGLTTLVFVNQCAGVLSFAGSELPGGTLQPGQFQCVDVGTADEPLSSKRYWGWLGEDPGAERHTLAEFTFNTDFYDFDWYNISHVDAHNLPMQIVPVARPDCHVETCAQDLLAQCPAEGLYRDSAGTVLACVSPDRDNPDSPVARYFEQCDDAYAWSGDDQQGSDPSPMRACAGEDWDIVFCPEGSP